MSKLSENKTKNIYETPQFEVLQFSIHDCIRTSGGQNEGDDEIEIEF